MSRPSAGTRRFIACILPALSSCGHAATGQQAPQPAIVATQGSAEASTEPPPPPEAEIETIESQMAGHFIIVAYARDTTIMGKTKASRRALAALADYDYGHVISGDWKPWVAKLQAAARTGAAAETLEATALAVTQTASVCGECHLARGAGPTLPARDEQAPAPKSLPERMKHHIWAADRMWEGLIVPSDKAWRAGATELANLPLEGPESSPPLRPEFVRELRQLRELGDHARGDYGAEERVQTYARFLSTCSRCHGHELDDSRGLSNRPSTDDLPGITVHAPAFRSQRGTSS